MPVINEWTGDAELAESRYAITILRAVPFAIYALNVTGTPGISYRATELDDVGTIADALAAALVGLQVQIEHDEGSDTIILIGEEGEAVDVDAPNAPSSYVRVVQAGRVPVDQELTVTLPAPTSGGTWSLGLDWGTGVETLSSISSAATPAQLVTAIEGLTTPQGGDVTAWLVHPGGSGASRVYRVRLGGTLAGKNALITVGGAALLGTATAEVVTVQDPREKVHEIQAIWVRDTNFTKPAWDKVLKVEIEGKKIETLKPNAGSAAWTAAAEELWGEGNVRVINYHLQGITGTRQALIVFVFMEEEAGIAHALATVNIPSGAGNYSASIQRLQAGDGSSSDEWTILCASGHQNATWDYKLTFDGETTAAIATDTESSIVPELEALTNVALNEPQTFVSPFPYATGDDHLAVVRWRNGKGNTNTPNLAPSYPLPSETSVDAFFKRQRVITSDVCVDDVQLLWSKWPELLIMKNDGVTGVANFNMAFDPPNAESRLQTAFNTAFGSGNTTVKILADPHVAGSFAVTVRFIGALAGVLQPLLKVWGGVSGVDATVVRLQNPQDPGRMWQAVNLAPMDFHYKWGKRPGTGYRLTDGTVTTGLIEPHVYDQIEPQLRSVLLDDVRVVSSPILQHGTAQNGTDVAAGVPIAIAFIGFRQVQAALTVTAANRVGCEIVDGSPLLDEIQRVIVRADGGTLRVRHNGGSYSTAQAWPMTNAQWDTRIEQAITGDATCIGLGTPESPLFVQFTGSQALTNVPLLEIDVASLTGGLPVLGETVIEGVPGLDAIQEINVDRNAVSGSLRANYDGAWSPDVAHNAAGSGWDTALESTIGIGSGNVIAEGPAGGPILVRFTSALGLRPVALLKLDQDNLVVAESGAMRIDELQKGTGPGYWNEPKNWKLGHVPETGEIAVLTSGKHEINAGLVQRTTWEIDGDGDPPVNTILVATPCDLVDGQKVRVRNVGGGLPAAQRWDGDSWETFSYSSATDLWVVSVDRLKGTVQLAADPDENAIRFTSEGTGVHWIEVRLEALIRYQKFTGKLGRPQRSKNGPFETRPLDLRIGFLTPAAEAESISVGVGDGSGADRFNVDFDGSPARVMVIASGGSTEAGVPAVNLKGSHADVVIEVLSGDVGYCSRSGETGSIKRWNQRGGKGLIGNCESAPVEIDFLDATKGTRLGHFTVHNTIRG